MWFITMAANCYSYSSNKPYTCLGKRTRALITMLFSCMLSISYVAQAADVENLQIGIIGSGKVGSALGKAWLNTGHQVMFSSQHLEDDQQLASTLGSRAHAGTPREAAAYGSVLLIAVPYAALPTLGVELGELINDKIIIDASNPIVSRDGEMAIAAREQGVGLASITFLPKARIVRAFNAIPAAKMAEAASKHEQYAMPIAGDEPQAIRIVSELIRQVGYEPVLVGSLAKMGKYLIPGTPLAGEKSVDELHKIASELK